MPLNRDKEKLVDLKIATFTWDNSNQKIGIHNNLFLINVSKSKDF